MTAFWDRLPAHIRQRLLTEHRTFTLSSRDELQTQNRLADHVSIILGGHAMEVRSTFANQHPVIGILGPGDAAGLNLLSGHPQRADVLPLRKGGVEVLRVPLARLQQLAKDHREVAAAVLRTMDDQHTREGFRLALALSPEVGADQRLAAHLVELAERFGRVQAGRASLELALTQEELGRYAGITRSRTNRLLARFRERGMLASDWRQITDLQGLRKQAEPFHTLASATLHRREDTADPAMMRLRTAELPSGLHWPLPARLPPDARHFTGRKTELGQLREALLLAPGTRVAVLHGPSGSGKSALSIKFARLFAEHFPDCQILVELRHRDIASILGAILRALGVPGESVPRGEEELTELYRQMVADRSVLLILEDADGNADRVKRLLPGTGSCAVIVNSKTPIRGLDAAHIPVGPLTEEDAVELVRRFAPGTSEHTRSELVRLCGYHPLALSVAAARLDGADVRGLQLGHEAAGASSAFMLAYRRLPDDQRLLFRFAALSAGPDFTVEALAALSGFSPEKTMHLLGELAQVNLVTPNGPRRYRQHAQLHEFALDRVRLESNERDRAQATGRLLDYYLAGARAHGRLLAQDLDHTGAPSSEARDRALDWFERERRCLTAAVRVAAETGRHRLAYRIADACFDFLELCRYGRENIEIHKIGLRSAQIRGDQRATAHMLRHLGVVHHALGQNLESVAYGWMARGIFLELGDRHGEALVEENLASVYQVLDQHTAAITSAERSRELHCALEDPRGEAAALLALTESLYAQGHYAEALVEAEKALAVQRAAGNLRGEARALRARANVLYESHRWIDTQRDAHRALAVCQQIKDGFGEARALLILAKVCRPLRELESGQEYARRALGMCRAAGDRHGEGWARIGLARLLIDAADLQEAMRHLLTALRVHTEIDHPSGQSAARTSIAIVLGLRGRLHDARIELEQALSLARQVGNRRGEARALETLGNVLRRLDQPKDARIFAEEALAAWRSLGHRHGAASALGGLARILLRDGLFGEAMRACDEAEEIRASLRDHAGLGRLGDTRAQILMRAGRHEEALTMIDSALPLLRMASSHFHIAEATGLRADILLALGRHEDAVEAAKDALTRAEALGDNRTEAWALLTLAQVSQHRAEHSQALDRLHKADLILVNVDDQGSRIPVLEARATSLHALGREEEAVRCLRLIEELRQWLARPTPPGG